MASTRLLQIEWTHHQKPISTPPNPGNNRQSTRCPTFHKAGRPMGI